MHLSRLKFLMVALLALLQCVLPLIHGHADAREAPGTHHVHFHADEFSPELPSASATPEFTMPGERSPAIGVSQEFKRDSFLLPIIGFIVAVFVAAALASRHVFFPRTRSTLIATRLRTRPPATAPPFLAA